MISHRKPNKNRSFIDVVKIGVNAMRFYPFFRSKKVNRRFIPQTIKFRLLDCDITVENTFVEAFP